MGLKEIKSPASTEEKISHSLGRVHIHDSTRHKRRVPKALSTTKTTIEVSMRMKEASGACTSII